MDALTALNWVLGIICLIVGAVRLATAEDGTGATIGIICLAAGGFNIFVALT